MYRDKLGRTWTTKSEMVDIETGEILTKHEYKKNYKKITYDITYGTEYSKNGTEQCWKKYTWLCRRTQQLRLEI